MSRKQFEHIENKFREAAENFQPPHNEDAWVKMERLLDQKEEEKSRAAGFWFIPLLVLLLLTSGVIIYYVGSRGSKPAERKESNLLISKDKLSSPQTTQQPVSPSKDIPSLSENTVKADKEVVARNNDVAIKPDITRTDTRSEIQNNTQQKATLRKKAGRNHVLRSGTKTDNDGIADIKNALIDERASALDKESVPAKRAMAYQQSKDKQASDATSKDAKANEASAPTPLSNAVASSATPAEVAGNKKAEHTALVKNIQKPVVNQVVQSASRIVAQELEQQRRLNQFLSGFYFTASLSTDGNAVRGSGIKNVTAMYGVGIGYQLNRRFSIQTGLYAGNKKYSTDSTGYYRKPGYWRMVKIKRIDADCFVYNVPLSVRYNLTLGREGSFYAVGGLSSYFMQKERYDYYYTYRSNDSLHHGKEVYGENRHLLAIVDLSLGYERKVGKHLSIQAEPYLKLPLKGIGEGKVNLYSAGFMLGFKLRP